MHSNALPICLQASAMCRYAGRTGVRAAAWWLCSLPGRSLRWRRCFVESCQRARASAHALCFARSVLASSTQRHCMPACAAVMQCAHDPAHNLDTAGASEWLESRCQKQTVVTASCRYVLVFVSVFVSVVRSKLQHKLAGALTSTT